MKKDKNHTEALEKMMDLYLAKKMSQEEIDELWAELIQDEEALEELKTRANLQALFESKRQPMRRILPMGNKVASWSRYAAAAAVLIVIASGLLFNLDMNQISVEPISHIDELGQYRSTDAFINNENGDEAVREAIVLANNGQHEEAIRRLDRELDITEDPSTQANLNINAGSIMYNVGRYEEAAERFQRVVETESIEVVTIERAYWYLGNAYFQMNEVENARLAFQKALDLNGAYSRVAQSYLRALAAN